MADHRCLYPSYREPEVPPCEVCGKDPCSTCDCPECPVCGVSGDPLCYERHGLTKPRFGYQESTPFTGVCCVCDAHIGMGITVQWNMAYNSSKKRWYAKSIQCLKHRKE